MILKQILEQKKAEIERLQALDINKLSRDRVDFLAAIIEAKKNKGAIIAELKSKSPSEGVIEGNYNPVEIAKAYEKGGACALSILTDERFFAGSFEHISEVKAAVSLPVLCKEFIIDEKQIYQAAASGADACLLIVRILSDQQLKHFIHTLERLNMTALVEVFDENEMERSLQAGAKLIGVNNRNLDTLEMDMGNIERLSKLVPEGVVLLSLSGAKTPKDLYHYASHYDGVLAGTALMRADDKVEFLQQALNLL
ncbi:MAG: indole-3-glycerol phosphate synthase TrpC [Francisellaceae bacterium]